MKRRMTNLFMIIFVCLLSSNAFALERRLYPVPLFLERQFIRSGMFIEFPVKKYEISVEEFLKKESGLSPEETALQNYLICLKEWTYFSCWDALTDQKGDPDWYDLIKIVWKDPFSGPYSKILMSVHSGDRVWFVLEPRAIGENKYYYYVSFVKTVSKRYVRADDIFDYFESYAVFAVTQSLLKPDEYPVLPLDTVNSLGSNSFKYVVKTREDKTPINVSKESRIVFHFTGQAFYLNLVEDKLSAEFLKKHPALAFYRRYLQAWSSGTKEEIEGYFAKPDTFKGMKRYIDGMTPSEFELHGKDVAKGAANVRFMIEADPFYFIFYASSKNTIPDKGYWGLARVYKDPKVGFKIFDWNTSDNLTRLFFETDLTKTKLKPMAMDHFKQLNNN